MKTSGRKRDEATCQKLMGFEKHRPTFGRHVARFKQCWEMLINMCQIFGETIVKHCEQLTIN